MRGGGWGGAGAQNVVHQKWPNQIFPIVNFVFSHDGPFFGQGGPGGGGLLPFFLRSNTVFEVHQ